MTLGLPLTIAILIVALITLVAMVWLERHKPPLGEVRLIPVIPIMMVAALIVVLMLAHLVSLATGHVLIGRRGPRI